MSSATRYSGLSDSQLKWVHDVCERYEAEFRAERSTSLIQEIEAAPVDLQLVLFRELIEIEFEILGSSEQASRADRYIKQYPGWQPEVLQAMSEHASAPDETCELTHIGRYLVQRRLGSGGFANVYLAYDDRLDRKVAIKVPHRQRLIRRDDVRRYLDEAQTLASLDHPHIVPVHDVGRDEKFPCYIVSKYIEGSDLSRRIKRGRLSWRETAALIAEIADALHHAHTRGLVHRDVKPGNILLDKSGTAFLADFGVALRDDDIPGASQMVGTPAYMSPEQTRGEGHRVDCRSDIYSLGAVLYEMLTGQRTFPGTHRLETMSQIAREEPKPPRQISDSIPKELERICLKALAKRARERYSIAKDMADELREFLQLSDSKTTSSVGGYAMNSTSPAEFDSSSAATPELSRTPSLDSDSAPAPNSYVRDQAKNHDSGSESETAWLIPRGLRSFGEEDSEFFLSLLPGPTGRQGVPASIQFWKTRIEEIDSEKTFEVGVLYGPSGCGKSSLMNAGLIPQLAESVAVLRMDAGREQLEAKLLKGLRKQFPETPAKTTLVETLALFRHAQIGQSHRKLLIVIDQFEQWLHGHQGGKEPELTAALRQCDGSRVQCIVLVRDDFWLALSRFMQELEVDLITGHNLGLVDLFDIAHASRVLMAFGRAFGRLPQRSSQLTAEQTAFIQQAIDGLSNQGKVISVRLALFAEMMKAEDWSPKTLKRVGGIEGVGVTFLEETFGSTTANPAHRIHQEAARAVLGCLLPDTGVDIKGQFKSLDELREQSGYANRPREFASLIKILDGELRLITPADPAGAAEATASASHDNRDERVNRAVDVTNGQHEHQEIQESPAANYQLTHDYLVHSLRIWINRKKLETRRGRAELRLADRTAMWTGRPERQLLPSFTEWLSIRCFTRTRNWSPSERRMMKSADRIRGIRWAVGTTVALLLVLMVHRSLMIGRERNLDLRLNSAVASMATSRGAVVPRAIRDLHEFPRDKVVTELRERYATETDEHKLAIAYALASFGEPDVAFLVSEIESASPIEVDNLSDALRDSGATGIEALRESARNSTAEGDWNLKHRLAVVALHVGDTSIAAEMCALSPDRIERLKFIQRWSRWCGDIQGLTEVLQQETDPNLISGFCCGLGGIPADEVGAESKRAWHPHLARWFKDSPEASVHSSAGWLLNVWDIEPLATHVKEEVLPARQWSVNSAGITMIHLSAGSFGHRFGHFSQFVDRGDFLKAPIGTVVLTRPFMMSDKEISVRQFLQMMDDSNYPDSDKPSDLHSDSLRSPTLDHPAQWCNWNHAVMFCNWLSHQEDLQPCYERTGHIWKIPTGEFEEWKRIDGANGYRLPTEAEWEYACRAGMTTQNPLGDIENSLLLQVYVGGREKIASVYGAEHVAEPCGTVCPNGWGLFDLHGNAREWVHDWYDQTWVTDEGEDSIATDPSGPERNKGALQRTVRDGIFHRNALVFTLRQFHLGFRVVRNTPVSALPRVENE